MANLDVDRRLGELSLVEDVEEDGALEQEAERDHRHHHPDAPVACQSIMQKEIRGP